jgi:membrane dipeptidase
MSEKLPMAEDFYSTSLVWDAHCGFESWPTTDLSCLDLWKGAGVDFLSVNVGYDLQPWHNTVEVLATYGRWLQTSTDYVLAGTVAEVRAAKAAGRMAVAFDLEGMNALNGSLDLLHLYHRLGVRQIVFTYNRNNSAGGGCHDEDTGLSDFGRAAIRAMNSLGMLVDCSHCGFRTSMEAMAYSSAPVIFSHSNPRALRDHERNITDEQAKACAATGGVVGVNGIGLFLGDDDIRTATLADHVEHYLDLLGPQHVGVGLDYFPGAERGDESQAGTPANEGFNEVLAGNQDYWPPAQYPGGKVRCARPQQLRELSDELLRRGRHRAEVEAVLGDNFVRVAEAVWG